MWWWLLLLIPKTAAVSKTFCPHPYSLLCSLAVLAGLKMKRAPGSGGLRMTRNLERHLVSALTRRPCRRYYHSSSLRTAPEEHGRRQDMHPLRPWIDTPTGAPPYKAIHLFRCNDQRGVVASISDLISTNGGNMQTCDLFVDADTTDGLPVFHSRSVFTYDPRHPWDRSKLQSDFQELHTHFQALESEVHVPQLQVKPKVGILCSSLTHCVVELLHRYESHELNCEISVCVSNHNLSSDSFLLKLLERHEIPFQYIPATSHNRCEEQVVEAVQDTDLLVLARYMQILSPAFLESYAPRDILNIHHGLLPSFKGANPYKQAYDSGVKIIGATTHFVTDDLDEGPIIEQLIERVSHRDTLQAFKSRTRALERQCLFNAVSYYLDHKIQRYSKDRCAIMN